jgi:Helicase HerA, central domain
MSNQDGSPSELIIGWKVTKHFDPKYWVDGPAKPHEHKPEDLIKVPAKTMANHTVAVAQSGSGKPFFLGRIVEEILLKTRSHVLIFDPNSDFRSVADVTDPKYWTDKAGYDQKTHRGHLPDEHTHESFSHLMGIGEEGRLLDEASRQTPA